MTIKNTTIVDTTSKYIVKSEGVGGETDQVIVDAEKLNGGNSGSKVSMIECHYQIINKDPGKNGTLKFSADSEEADGPLGGLLLTGKYGLRPGQLKFGNDKKMTIKTDALVKSYLLVTEFRRNN
mgnify:FL=1|tara:strand:- start:51 stop:422 length:372 start_codon:yes stop_codon:yes gene_type:complete